MVTVTTDVIDGDHSAAEKVSSVLPPVDDIAVAAEIRIERAVETQANGREICEPPLTPMRDERDAVMKRLGQRRLQEPRKIRKRAG